MQMLRFARLDGRPLHWHLFLLYDNRTEVPKRLVSWRSEATKLTTDWRGYFIETIAGFDVYFHCKGKTLHRSSLIMGGAGQDYLGRAIIVAVQGHYILGAETMEFVVGQRSGS